MACKILRIGVFFDGTDNSKENISEYSNIAKLHEGYSIGEFEDEKGKITQVESVYIVGLGHGEGEDAMSLAAGKYGAKKVYKAIDEVEDYLDIYTNNEDDEEPYKTRLIDVFGFSRGAAEARDFVNTFANDSIII